jgi:hypothetical protein
MDELLTLELLGDPCEEIVARTVPFSYNRVDVMRKSSLVLESIGLKRLPLLSTSDFLFGGTSYGEWHIEDLQETKDII